jgi:hypothetical protein
MKRRRVPLPLAVLAVLTGIAFGCGRDTPVAPRQAAKLAFTTQPSTTTVGVAINPAVAVAVQDAFGNPVADAGIEITLTLAIGNNPPGAILLGTTTKTATSTPLFFTDLSIEKAGTGFILVASSPGLTSDTTSPFDVTPGTPVRLSFATHPSNATAGVAISPAVQVEIQDLFHNRVPDATGQILVYVDRGTLRGTTTVNAVAGVATFSDLSLEQAGTRYVLGAESPLGATPQYSASSPSRPFDISAAAPAQLRYATQPSNAAAGTAISPAVQVEVQDQFGNRATTASTSIDVYVTTFPCILTDCARPALAGTVTLSAANGVATFNDLAIQTAGSGYELGASSFGLTSATSNAFDITPGAAAQLVFTQQPPSSVTQGEVFTVVVQIQDEFGNHVTTADHEIVIQLEDNPSSARITATNSQFAVNGTANFDLTIGWAVQSGLSGHTLSASANGLIITVSSSFTVF